MDIIEKGKSYIKFISTNGYICLIFKRKASQQLQCQNCGENINKNEDYYRLKTFKIKFLCKNCTPLKLELARANRKNGNLRFYEEPK